jgi:3-hydroxybutyryl-CoA dehydratase
MEATVKDKIASRHVTEAEVWLQPFHKLEIGREFTTKARTVTETDVVQFAALTGDWHPAHSDATYAEQNFFGQRVAHGMLCVAYSIGLVQNDYVVALRRMKNIVFKRPVFFGDTIRVHGKVIGLRPISEEVGMVTGRWRIVNQDDELICKMELEALWRNDYI